MSERPELCVGAVAISDDALLMVQRATEPGAGKWSLPGGRVEHGELLAEALVREVHEETGVDVVCGDFIDWVERISDEFHFVIADFWVTPMSADAPVSGTDAAAARWVPIVELLELPLVDGLASFLSDHRIIDGWA